MIYGYARVSTIEQDTAAQVEQLTACGAAKVFRENISGKNVTDRPQLKKALAALHDGDVLLVTRIDRLARSTRDLLNIVHDVKQAGATFKSIAEPWADTSSELSEFMLTVLGAAAKLERATILARTSEGRARAKAKGKSLGRPFKLTAAQQTEARAMLGAGRGVCEVAEVFNVSHSTISRLQTMEREPTDDERRGMDWWNALSESDRAAWLRRAGSAMPAAAWAAFQRANEKPLPQ